MTAAVPTLTHERALLEETPLVFALDEVGRGALAGPVTIGASVLDARAADEPVPDGLRDSKLVPARRRPQVAGRAAAWVRASGLGWATAGEVDEVGIVRALGLAALRALASVEAQGFAPAGGVVLLDGNHDYITPAGAAALDVRTVVKGDRDCASLAAASVIAKVARDALMAELDADFPVYGWASNKGYASASHRSAIREHGLSAHHRRSWAIADAPALF
ncbi:ribonuclease HII [Microbacterium betulae]|uniref:Ribonuclease n=1 Tax=Microbacterium betulae TaxID=2981139 RepID=A0AA97FEK5_9MICO|nr:ribonuclease HII [Microbacterium sp. AB]WOF21580.1 ribonuclease HII [Microbacterium sp. AB]